MFVRFMGVGTVAELYTPNRAAQAAISKDSIFVQLGALFQQTSRCIPIVWQKLVMPIVLAKLEEKPIPHLDCTEQSLHHDLKAVLKERSQRRDAIRLLCRYDYIRHTVGGRYTAGTRLWTEVDASRMLGALNRSDRSTS